MSITYLIIFKFVVTGLLTVSINIRVRMSLGNGVVIGGGRVRVTSANGLLGYLGQYHSRYNSSIVCYVVRFCSS